MRLFLLLPFMLYPLAGLSGCGKARQPVPSEATTKVSIPIRVSGEERTSTLHKLAHPTSAGDENFERNKPSALGLSMKYFSTHRVHSGEVTALVVSRDGETAYSGGQDGLVVMSSIVRSPRSSSKFSGVILSKVLLESSDPVLALTLNAEETRLAVAQFSSVVVYDIERAAIIHRLTRVDGRILSLAWDPHGQLIAMGRANGDVFVWDLSRRKSGRNGTTDSDEALEQYEGYSISPNVGVVFHPSGRSFFTADRDGAVLLWRLLRTERELGLRDESAVRDQKRISRTPKSVGAVPGGVEDLWLSSDGSELLVSSSSGAVYRWKVRGLRLEQTVSVGEGSVFAARYFDLEPKIMVTSGRDQRLRFWCKELKESSSAAQGGGYGSAVVVIDVPGDSESGPESGVVESLAEPRLSRREGFVGESGLFENPLVLLQVAREAPLLWAAEKTGNLLSFDASVIFSSSQLKQLWHQRAQNCK